MDTSTPANCKHLHDAKMAEVLHNHLQTLRRLLSSTTCWGQLQGAKMAKSQLAHDLLTSTT
eukprot:11210967-Lingulodinium_polyedra.AAC.1